MATTTIQLPEQLAEALTPLDRALSAADLDGLLRDAVCEIAERIQTLAENAEDMNGEELHQYARRLSAVAVSLRADVTPTR